MRHRNILVALATAAIVVGISGCAPASIHTLGDSVAVAPSVPVANGDQLGREDGYIPTGETVKLTDDVPAVTKLDPRLRDALDRAAADAVNRGVTFTLTDGWRSERYQEYLFAQAVQKYGSEEEASRWVKRGTESKHERGQAVDIATADAMDWLTRFGAEYGLCQAYANESWHFELLGDGSGECPAQLTDGTAG